MLNFSFSYVLYLFFFILDFQMSSHLASLTKYQLSNMSKCASDENKNDSIVLAKTVPISSNVRSVSE